MPNNKAAYSGPSDTYFVMENPCGISTKTSRPAMREGLGPERVHGTDGEALSEPSRRGAVSGPPSAMPDIYW